MTDRRPNAPGIPGTRLPRAAVEIGPGDRPGDRQEPPPEPRRALPPEPGSSPEGAPVPQQDRIPVMRGSGPESSGRRSWLARSPDGGTPWSSLWSAAGRWSPAGIAAGLLLVFLALGGREGVVGLVAGLSESVGQAKALREEMAQFRGEMAALRTEVAQLRTSEQEQRDALSVKVARQENNIRLTCALASKLNKGKPQKHWCSKDGLEVAFEADPAQGSRIPLYVTSAEWQHPP